MRAASLNRGEFLAGLGTHGPPGTWKAVGNEGAGDVAAVGARATAARSR
jgi:NADPH:quinone reductase-like Zn-dependent oxidoreductase